MEETYISYSGSLGWKYIHNILVSLQRLLSRTKNVCSCVSSHGKLVSIYIWTLQHTVLPGNESGVPGECKINLKSWWWT